MLFGDGAVVIEVVGQDRVAICVATVSHGGLVQGRPGVHIPSDRLRIASPTPDDLRMLDAFVERGVDMVAISFVRSAHDVRRVGTEPHPRGPLVVAKIETRAAVENLEGIIEASGRDHGRPGRPRRRAAHRGAPAPAEAHHPDLHRAGPAGDHRHPDAGVDGPRRHPDPGRGHRRGQRRVRRLQRGHALGRDRHRPRPGAHVVRTMADIARRADEEFDYDGWAPHITELRAHRGGRRRRPRHRHHDAWPPGGRPPRSNADAILCISRTGFTVRAIARFRPRTKILGLLARRAHRPPAHHELGRPADARRAAGEQRVHGAGRGAQRPRSTVTSAPATPWSCLAGSDDRSAGHRRPAPGPGALTPSGPAQELASAGPVPTGGPPASSCRAAATSARCRSACCGRWSSAASRPDLVLGCSVGALNGAAYAADPTVAGRRPARGPLAAPGRPRRHAAGRSPALHAAVGRCGARPSTATTGCGS